MHIESQNTVNNVNKLSDAKYMAAVRSLRDISFRNINK